MNICLISFEYPPESGGIGTYTYALAHGLTCRGHTVHVLTSSHEEHDHHLMDGEVHVHRVVTRHYPLPPSLRRRGAHTIALLERTMTIARYIKGLHRTVGFDIVEAPNWNAEALMYSLRPLAPLVIRISTTFATAAKINVQTERTHGTTQQSCLTPRRLRATFRLRVRHWLEALPVRRATQAIALSRYIAEVAQSTYRLPTERMHIVPLGLDESTFVPASRSQSRMAVKMGSIAGAKPTSDTTTTELNDFGKQTDQRTVLYVGRLERRKGTRHLLEAIPEVVAAVPGTHFLIIGKDTGDAVNGTSYQSYFESFASPEARGSTTFLTRVQPDRLEQEYAACTVFAAPSLSESFGLVHLEAMAHGKAVVACHAGATPEIVINGETGLLVPPQDSHALAHALIRLLRTPDEARQMGARGRQRAISEFSIDRMVDDTLAIYERLKC